MEGLPDNIFFQEFVFVICTVTDYVPAALASIMHVIKVQDKQGEVGGEQPDIMEQVASLYGAAEVVRNSLQLVEAAFDGELDEINSWIEKGYHIESTDGRKHTALSEAACQGHLDIVNHLLEMGADPNAVSDTGRSPLWRAAFNSHVHVARALLEAGSDPDLRDKVSMEGAFDVAQTEEMRTLLVRTAH